MALGQFVVLHGMAGAGKSVLAAETVRCVDLTTITFDNNVFWLTIGQTDKDTLLTKMQVINYSYRAIIFKLLLIKIFYI